MTFCVSTSFAMSYVTLEDKNLKARDINENLNNKNILAASKKLWDGIYQYDSDKTYNSISEHGL